MNKKIKLILSLIALLCICGLAYATGIDKITPSSIFPEKVQAALGIATWIGLIVGVVMVIWVGGKYLMAGAGEKAKAKETLVPMLIGACLIALAPMIINTIYTTMTTGAS